MNYVAKQRLFMIDALICHYGYIHRSIMMDALICHYGYIHRSIMMDCFGISLVQASKDLQQYLALAPTNLVYNPSAKRYEKRAEFVRVAL